MYAPFLGDPPEDQSIGRALVRGAILGSIMLVFQLVHAFWRRGTQTELPATRYERGIM